MVDYVKKDGFFYRNSYPFRYKPTQVRICAMMWWRFPVFGLTRLFGSLFLWVIGLLPFGVLPWATVGLYHILMGKKLVYNPSRESSFIIGDRFLDRIVFLNYTSIPVDRLPLVAGKQILPIYPVVVIVIPLALWYIVLVAASATVSGAQGAWAWVTWLAAEFMSLSLWIPITIVVGFALLSLLIWGIREFRKSEIYGLMLMSFMAGIDKICPIIPVK